VAGVWLAHAMFAEPILQVSATGRDGLSQALSEGVATFGLLLAILGGLAARPQPVPALVGLWIASAYWFTASTSFANPAVTLARAFTDSFAGISPASVPAFLASQLAGALLAAALAGWLLRR
jgi:glycerol uptake facilitator-like aquaporin